MPAPPITTDIAEVEQTEGVTYCASCPHSQDEHDATALRYCAATLNTVLSRGCICRPR
jgi:hypothetical protein